MNKVFNFITFLPALTLLGAGLSGCEEFGTLQFGLTAQPSTLPSAAPSVEPSVGTSGTPMDPPKSEKDSWMNSVQVPGPAPTAFPSNAGHEPQGDPTPVLTETPLPTATPVESPSASLSPSPSPSPSATVEAEFIDPEWVVATQDYTNGTTAVNAALLNDGIDDTAAIQAHINFALSSQRHVVYFPAGVYHLTGTLTLPSGITLRGSDRLSQVDPTKNSTLIYSGTAPQGVMIDLTPNGGTAYQTIEYLHFKGAPGLLYFIRMDMGFTRRIRYNLFEEFPAEAAAIGGGNVMFSYIEANQFRNYDGQPIRLAQNLSRNPAAGYYGNNVGTIAGNQFLGHRGIIVNGIFSILANTFQIDGTESCAISLGDPAVSGGTDLNPTNSVQSQIHIAQNLFQLSGGSSCGVATSPYILTSIRGNKFEGTGTQYGINAGSTSRVLSEGNQFNRFAVGIIYRNGSAYPLAFSENKFFQVERPLLAWGATAVPTVPPSPSVDEELNTKLVSLKGAATSANFTEVSGVDRARSLDLRLGQFGFSPRTVIAGALAATETGNLFDLGAGARLPASGYLPGSPVLARATDAGAGTYQIQFADRQGNLPSSFGAGITIEPPSSPSGEATPEPVSGPASAADAIDFPSSEFKTAFRLVTVTGCTTTACEVQLDLRNGTVFEVINGTVAATIKLRPPLPTDPRVTLANYQGTLFVLGNSRTSRSSLSLSPEVFSNVSVSTLAPGEYLLLVVDATGTIREVTQGGSR